MLSQSAYAPWSSKESWNRKATSPAGGTARANCSTESFQIAPVFPGERFHADQANVSRDVPFHRLALAPGEPMIILGRLLKLYPDWGEIDVPITIQLPVDMQNHWQ